MCSIARGKCIVELPACLYLLFETAAISMFEGLMERIVADNDNKADIFHGTWNC